ncbi:MAG: cobalamin B12-binding domain-containing protein, partial [Acidimicrobiales bacterium]
MVSVLLGQDEDLDPLRVRDFGSAGRSLAQAALAGDPRRATSVIRRLLGEGARGFGVAQEVLCPLLSDVGDQWHRNALSSAEANQVIEILSSLVPTLENHDPPMARLGRVVLACAPGELHSLPARLVASDLRRRGWDVVFLGISVPPDELRTVLRRLRPRAVLLSCTSTGSLSEIPRAAAAAHEVGVPVILGGAAVQDSTRARKLGADGYANDGGGAAALLVRGLKAAAYTVVERSAELGVLARSEANLLDALEGTVSLSGGAETTSLKAAIGSVLSGLAGALATEDEAVAMTATDWATRFLLARGHPAWATSTVLDQLRASVPDGMDRLERYIECCLDDQAQRLALASTEPPGGRRRPSRAPRPKAEPARLAEVDRLFPSPERGLGPVLVELARWAAEACKAPSAYVTLV